MLVLSRKIGESIFIGDDIEVKIISTSKDKVKLGFEAPKNVTLLRGELRKAIAEANIEASKSFGNIDTLKNLHIKKSE